MRPFTTVESESLRAFVHEAEPMYRFPNAATVSEQIIPAWYTKVKDQLQTELNGSSFVAVTSDAWTSRRTESYSTFTAHYIHDNCLKARVLDTHILKGSHTGENLAKDMESTLTAWQLRDKLCGITTDNAANIVLGCRLLKETVPNIIHIPCFAHTLNLAAQRGNETLEPATHAIKPIITYFHHSTIGKQVLREKQIALDLPVHDLITECPTRWNSGYLAKKRFMEQRPAILAAILDPRLANKKDTPDLSDEHVVMIKEYLRIMEDLYEATLLMSSERMPTAGLILPLITKLLQTFSPTPDDSTFVTKLKAALRKDLSSRYKQKEILQFLEEASALDPRTKRKQCIGPDTWERLEKAVSEIIDTEDADKTENEDEDEARLNEPPHKKMKMYSLLEDEDDENEVDGQSPFPDQIATQEIESYRKEPRLAYNDDPVQYWTKKSSLKNLSKLAQKYLVAQATSVPSERVFSTAGDIISAQRSCLSEDSAGTLIFLKKNLSQPMEI